MCSTAPQTIGSIKYNRFIHSYKRKLRQLHLRIHCLYQSDNILTFCLHLVVPHDYVISFFVNKFYRKPAIHTFWILIIPFWGFLIAVLRHSDDRIVDRLANIAVFEGLRLSLINDIVEFKLLALIKANKSYTIEWFETVLNHLLYNIYIELVHWSRIIILQYYSNYVY